MDYSAKEDIVEYVLDKVKYLTLPSKSNDYKSKFLESNTLLYCVILFLILKIISTFAFINFPQNIFFADLTRTALVNFTNQTRQSFGLQPLTENPKLDRAAEMKAENMISNNYFSHTSPTGISPWHWFSQVGYNYKYAGENLAIGFYESQEVYNAWLNSPSHKANLVNPNYKETGIAILKGFGQNSAIVVVQLFGSQKNSSNVNNPANNVKKLDTSSEYELRNDATVDLTENSQAGSVDEKVLSQSTESQGTIEASKSGSSGAYYKIMNSVLYNYSKLLDDIIYGISFVIIGILAIIIFFSVDFNPGKFGVNFNKKLVFRSTLVVILLSLAMLLNKQLIISVIPHQMII